MTWTACLGHINFKPVRIVNIQAHIYMQSLLVVVTSETA